MFFLYFTLIQGPSDPYQRISAKPTKRCTSAGPYSKELDSCDVDRCRSPVTESVSHWFTFSFYYLLLLLLFGERELPILVVLIYYRLNKL